MNFFPGNHKMKNGRSAIFGQTTNANAVLGLHYSYETVFFPVFFLDLFTFPLALDDHDLNMIIINGDV